MRLITHLPRRQRLRPIKYVCLHACGQLADAATARHNRFLLSLSSSPISRTLLASLATLSVSAVAFIYGCCFISHCEHLHTARSLFRLHCPLILMTSTPLHPLHPLHPPPSAPPPLHRLLFHLIIFILMTHILSILTMGSRFVLLFYRLIITSLGAISSYFIWSLHFFRLPRFSCQFLCFSLFFQVLLLFFQTVPIHSLRRQ